MLIEAAAVFAGALGAMLYALAPDAPGRTTSIASSNAKRQANISSGVLPRARLGG